MELQEGLGAERRERRKQDDDPASPTLGMYISWHMSQKHAWRCYFV